MTEDYAKARDFGNRLLKCDRNDADVIRALNILKQKDQYKIEECERLSSIDSPIEFDNESGGSDATDGEDADFVDDNANSRIDPTATSKIASHGMSQLNIDKVKINLDFKQRMHRVIPIEVNKEKLHK
ncbi:uncharacterized protein LOC115245932 [Formica exsecta]|uniref:uncharacterized protein LOC115245932 n=1 Tax=Formica exsecta TaxID=72781 RepID=UPI0011433A8B|nr:uncharacterized protein LOC115245932 [Formica exsecta]